jgi:3-isopropylmalate/(R)-2-methylmalate dehydratase small subunit
VAIHARTYVFKDNVDTDQIYPGRYLELVEPHDLAAHVMEGADPGFSARFVRGSVIVAGRNFGCGSSREHAPISLRAAGVSCVVAESFGRIFYRNAINVGLPLLKCEGVRGLVSEGDTVIVDLGEGTVFVEGTGVSLKGEPLSERVLEILKCGGLVNYVRNRLGREAALDVRSEDD